MDRPMTKQRVARYRELQEEIAMLKSELENAEQTFDTVQSSAEFPYNKHNVVITGLSAGTIDRYQRRLDAKLEESAAIEKFFDSIDDSLMWQVLTLRYIKGESLQDTAKAVNYSESRVSNMISDYFKNESFESQSN